MAQPLAEATEGDFHFELHKKEDGNFTCLRSDISDPMKSSEEVTEMQDIPSEVFRIFSNCMH